MSRLNGAVLHRLSMPLVRPFRTSFGVEMDRQCVLVELEADDGVGWGECVAGSWPGYSYETASTAWVVLRDHFLPAVLGEAIDSPDDLRGRLAPFRGHPLARAGLELAWWDLEGRRRGRSVQRMLGGEAERVAVGVSIGIYDDLGALLDRVEGFLSEGYRRVKVKIEPGSDTGPLRALRKRYPDLPLQVDANAAYSMEDLPIFEALDELGLLMIEQPLAEEDLLGHSRLQAELETPLCLDESVRSLAEARQAVEMDACRVINIKAGRVGGLSEAVAIHDYCRQVNVPVWCGGMLETGVGRAANLALASLPGFRFPGDISATDRYYEVDVAEPRFELEDGCLPVPQEPGLGVQVRGDRVSQFEIDRSRLP